jgi:hypothetical protein
VPRSRPTDTATTHLHAPEILHLSLPWVTSLTGRAPRSAGPIAEAIRKVGARPGNGRSQREPSPPSSPRPGVFEPYGGCRWLAQRRSWLASAHPHSSTRRTSCRFWGEARRNSGLTRAPSTEPSWAGPWVFGRVGQLSTRPGAPPSFRCRRGSPTSCRLASAETRRAGHGAACRRRFPMGRRCGSGPC